jgi:GTP cyclohydrolase I
MTVRGKLASAVAAMLTELGEDLNRPGLLETPERVAKAWIEWTSGSNYTDDDIARLLKVFPEEEAQVDEMVIVRDIEFYSHCEHHMAPFFGTAHVAYIPGESGALVGLSKLARLVDVFSLRLQVQERITNQIADALEKHLGAHGVGVVMQAKHFCMCSRGVGKQGSSTVTSALRGAMRQGWQRAEFFSLLKQ